MNNRYFLYIAFLSFTFFGSCSGIAHAPDPLSEDLVLDEPKFTSKEEELTYLNNEIKELQEERDRYRSRATQAKNQGDRLQFQTGRIYEARRYWKIAKVSNDIADRIDAQIKVLEAQRQPLLDAGVQPAQ